MANANTILREGPLAAGLLLCAAALAILGCGSRTSDSRANELLFAQAPAGAVDVLTLRSDAQDKQDVIVVGRVGGRKDPWVKGMAAFPIVDRTLRPCNEIPGDACPTPWDYCCESNLPDATVLVRLVDESGSTIKKDPRELLGLKELQTVVVQGKVKRDKEGNVTIIASRLHIQPDSQAKE
jgi:hypothetical protein